MTEKISLEKSLLAYRTLHTPAALSWKQWWVNETFTHDDLYSCSDEEHQQFSKRLEECKITMCDNIKQTQGKVVTLNDLLNTLTDPLRQNIKKMDRNVVYGSTTGARPIGKAGFDVWGGFQVIDMDIKNRECAEYFKRELFNRLKKYNWFFGVAFSSSGQGLHIYTKIQVAEAEQNDDLRKKILFLTNFRHKYSFVYLACLKIIEGTEWTKDDVIKWMDLAMFKPQQGAFIGYDLHPLINTHFFEDFIQVCFDNVEDMGHPNVDWVSHPDLKETFKRWEWFEEGDSTPTNIELINPGETREEGIRNRVHYKHFERWRLANTLVKIYGFEKGFRYLQHICTEDIPTQELRADCKTANDHDKQLDPWAINRLNKFHGFDIKVKIDEKEADIGELYDNVHGISNPTLIKASNNYKEFYIKKNEYLQTLGDKLLKEFERITLLEAGAGVGKTEMTKNLAKMGKKIMLVMPFTSTIKSKIESEMKSNPDDDTWYWSYGARKVRLDTNQSVALTIDKFSHLNLMEVKEAGFDYIFVDESHLLFQSEYRPVMPKVIEMISNTEVPIILMSGTPIGETVFFPDIKHIKVIKEDVRVKTFEVHMLDMPSDSLYKMCDDMARDIFRGYRVLFPSNKGSLYKEQISALVKYFLQTKYEMDREPVINYYKKSNVGETFMDLVNFEKTVGNTDILMCSTYLSVGVDILDKFEFNIYFNELWMPQEVEQFANRLRSHDLNIRLYINRKASDGVSLNICGYRPCNFSIDESEVKDAHSIVRLCNAMIERNPIEYKYNSLVAGIIRDNKFIEYNGVENKYYLNEVAYKTIYFERKYRDYVEQLPVLIKGMEVYGYNTSSVEDGVYQFVEGTELADAEQAYKDAKTEKRTLNSLYVDELISGLQESYMDFYREILRGRYDLVKGDCWLPDIQNHIMTVKSIEIFERVIPLVVSFSKMYEVEEIQQIFEICKHSSGMYNLAAAERMRMLVNMVYNDNKKRLDVPIKDYITKCSEFLYMWSDENPCTRDDLFKFIAENAIEYATVASTEAIPILKSPLTIQKIEDNLLKIFKCMIKVGRPNKDGEITLEKVDLGYLPDKETKSAHRNSIDLFASKSSYTLLDFLENMKIKEDILTPTELN